MQTSSKNQQISPCAMSRLDLVTFRFSVGCRCAIGIVTKWCDFPPCDVTFLHLAITLGDVTFLRVYRTFDQTSFHVCAIGGYIQTGSLLHSKPIGTPVFKYRILLIEKFVHDAVPLGFASVGWLPVFCGVTFAIAVPLCGVTSGSV